MSPASFAAVVTEYAEFVAQKNGSPLSHCELDAIRMAAYSSFSGSEMRLGRAKIDGLEAVEWIKKYRNEFGTTLRDAKDEWDKRLALKKQATLPQL